MGWGWALGTLGPRVAGQGRLLPLPFTQVSFPCGIRPVAHPPCRPLLLNGGPPGYLQAKDNLEALTSSAPEGLVVRLYSRLWVSGVWVMGSPPYHRDGCPTLA